MEKKVKTLILKLIFFYLKVLSRSTKSFLTVVLVHYPLDREFTLQMNGFEIWDTGAYLFWKPQIPKSTYKLL